MWINVISQCDNDTHLSFFRYLQGLYVVGNHCIKMKDKDRRREKAVKMIISNFKSDQEIAKEVEENPEKYDGNGGSGEGGSGFDIDGITELLGGNNLFLEIAIEIINEMNMDSLFEGVTGYDEIKGLSNGEATNVNPRKIIEVLFSGMGSGATFGSSGASSSNSEEEEENGGGGGSNLIIDKLIQKLQKKMLHKGVGGKKMRKEAERLIQVITKIPILGGVVKNMTNGIDKVMSAIDLDSEDLTEDQMKEMCFKELSSQMEGIDMGELDEIEKYLKKDNNNSKTK